MTEYVRYIIINLYDVQKRLGIMHMYGNNVFCLICSKINSFNCIIRLLLKHMDKCHGKCQF